MEFLFGGGGEEKKEQPTGAYEPPVVAFTAQQRASAPLLVKGPEQKGNTSTPTLVKSVGSTPTLTTAPVSHVGTEPSPNPKSSTVWQSSKAAQMATASAPVKIRKGKPQR